MNERLGRIIKAPRLVPAHLEFTCNGLIFDVGKTPDDAYPCRQRVETHNFNQGPGTWSLHPEFGWLCMRCSEANGEPRVFPGVDKPVS